MALLPQPAALTSSGLPTRSWPLHHAVRRHWIRRPRPRSVRHGVLHGGCHSSGARRVEGGQAASAAIVAGAAVPLSKQWRAPRSRRGKARFASSGVKDAPLQGGLPPYCGRLQTSKLDVLIIGVAHRDDGTSGEAARRIGLKVLYREHTNEEHRNPRFIYEKAGRKRAKAEEDAEAEPKEAAPVEEDSLAEVMVLASSPSITETELEDDVPLPEPSSSSKGPGLQFAATPCRSTVFGKGWQGNAYTG
eukprot:s625_g8.t1